MPNLTQRISTLEKLLAAATPGPWDYFNRSEKDEWGIIRAVLSPGQGHGALTGPQQIEMAEANWQLIITTRNELPRLLEDMKKMREALTYYGDCQCDAKWSGRDEAEYRARGCPHCSCSNTERARQVLEEVNRE